MNRKSLFFVLVVFLAVLTALAQQAPPQLLNESLLNGLTYRNMGPYRAGAWAVGIAIPETPAKAHRSTIYAALRSGGVWKSSNGGVTFEPVMDSQSIYSMGAIAVAPSDENVVWVGTGDNSATRSAYWGDGVYKSVDGGETWQNMGLKDTQHIARIVIHPTRPDTVYVAALGHLATPNAERGVFKTTDGGKSWKKVLYVNDRTGAVDLVRDPRNPEVLYAATYEHERLAWVINDGGPGTGIYKTTDGGASWTELTQRPAEGPHGADRHRHLPQQTRGPLRGVRQPQPASQPAKSSRTPSTGRSTAPMTAGVTWRRVNPDEVDVSGKAGYSFNQLVVDPEQSRPYLDHGVEFQLLGGRRQDLGRARGAARLRSRFWRLSCPVG